MRLHTITSKNFLSLRDCHISDLDQHMNFLVGPNGGGKTSIFRLLRMMRDVIITVSEIKRPLLKDWCTHGVLPQEIDISVNVEFNTSWEKELIIAFICASLSQPEILERPLSLIRKSAGRYSETSWPVERFIPFTNWLTQCLRPEATPFLFRGDLRITYQSLYDYIRISYTFLCEGEPITIVSTPFTSGVPFASSSNGTFWRGNPPEELQSGTNGVSALLTYLKIIRSDEIDETYSTKDYEIIAKIFNKQNKQVTFPFSAEAFFQLLADRRGYLRVEPIKAKYAPLPTYIRLRDMSGITLDDHQQFTIDTLLSLLLKQAFVFTNNVRTPLSSAININVAQALSQYANLDNEQQVPMWLFRLKNGDMEEQDRFRNIQRTFTGLLGNGLSFDLTTKPLQQQSANTSQEPILTVDVRVTDIGGDVSLPLHGSGVWEALILSTILDESEGKVVLLDEPAANLHPGMQRKLLEVLRVAPGQMIVATHSAHLLPTYADEFQRVYRVQKTHLGTQIFSLGRNFVAQQDKLENELRSSSDVAGLLFADGVLLVEGATEIGAFGQWFPQSLASQGKTFADYNIVLYAVGGKAEFPFYLRFLTAFGLPWTVICDGDALLPPNKSPNDKLWKVLKELQFLSEVPNATISFETLKAQAAKARVYTFNTPSPTKFETLPEVEHYLNAEWTPAGKTAYRGRYIALHLSCPSTVDEVLQQAIKQLLVDESHQVI